MDSMKYVSSPSLSSSPSTKEQSTEQPKSSENKSMEDDNRQEQKPSKTQLVSKSKKQKKNDIESGSNSDIKNYNMQQQQQQADSQEEGEEETLEKGQKREEGLPSKKQIDIISEQVLQNADQVTKDQGRGDEEDQIDDYDPYEDDDEEEEDDDNFFYREGDIGCELGEDGTGNVKQKKNKFTKEFMNVIRTNSEELRNEKNDDPLDYLFVIDFECNQPGSEIIEFPITVIDLKLKKVTDTFHSYVRPTKIKKLSSFIKKLTGIKQEDVDASDSIQTIITRVETFLSKYNNSKAAVLYDCANDAKFLSNEIRNKQLNITNKFLLSYINLRNVFPISLTGGIKNISLSHALEVLDMSFEGQKHTGRDDAINIARVCLEMTNHQFVFTQFMRQSQFCADNPKRLVEATINDLFKMNNYLIAIDLKFYGDKKELNAKNQMILCKSFKLHLFQFKQPSSQSATTAATTTGTSTTTTAASSTNSNQTTSPSTSSSTPQKSGFKLKTVAEKIAEQQQLNQQKQQQQQQQQQQDSQSHQQQAQPEKLNPLKSESSTPEPQQLKLQSSSSIPKQQQQQQPQQCIIEEIDSYSQEFNNLQYQIQDYYELLQNLIDMYHKYNIKNQNAFILLNCSTKQKYFSKFFKFITAIFKTSKTAFIFKKKILNLQDLLEKQIIINKTESDEIIMEEFPQNVIKLADYFQSQNFKVKELPQSFQKRYVITIPDGQASTYNDQSQYQYQMYGGNQAQYNQYLASLYGQQQQPGQPVNAQGQQQSYMMYPQIQMPQNIDYFNPSSTQAGFNQLQMMYSMQHAQSVYNQQAAAAYMGQQQPSQMSGTYPYYFQQAMSSMNSNIMYQMSLLNPNAFSYPPNYMDSNYQQQVLYHQQQQYLQQLESEYPPAVHLSPHSSPSQKSQQPNFNSVASTTTSSSQSQQTNLKEQGVQQSSHSQGNISGVPGHHKNNSVLIGSSSASNFKNNNGTNPKNEGQNLSNRKKNFRNNSNIFNGFSSGNSGNYFYNPNNNNNNNNSNNNNTNQNYPKNNQTKSNNPNSTLLNFQGEGKHSYSTSGSSSSYNNFQSSSYPSNSGFQKSGTYNNSAGKNKFYKK